MSFQERRRERMACVKGQFGGTARGAVALALVVAVCAAGTSCTRGGGEDGVAAKELCHGSLTEGAARAVRTLSTGDKGYQETRGMTFREAARALRNNDEVTTSRSLVCRVHAQGDRRGDDPLFQVEFVHVGAPEEDVEHEEHEETGVRGRLRYAMGERAHSDDNGAFVSFRCAGGLRRGDPPLIAGNVDVPFTDRHAELSGPARGRTAMAVLHAVSRAMAERLGCLEESRIPGRQPDPVTTSDGR